MGLFGNFFGGGAKINYQPPQNIQNFMQPVPVTDMQKTDFYGRLLNDKQGYDTAQKSIDLIQRALQTPELSEASRNNWRRKMQGYEEARDAYAQDANSVRQSAASLGLDVSDYDTNKSLQESAQAFQNYRNTAVKDFLNLPSMADLEENRYMELRSQGASPGQADRILNRERGKMRDQLSRRYTDAMATYGTNPDGSLDQNIGIQLLRGLKEVDPATAQMFYGGFATPQKVFDANKQYSQALDVTNLTLDSAWQRALLNANASLLQSRESQAAQNERLDATLKAQEKEGERQRAFQDKWNTINTWIKGSGGGSKMMNEVNEIFMALGGGKEGLTDEENQKLWNRATDTWLRENHPQLYNAKLSELEDWDKVADALNMPPEQKYKFLLDKVGWNPEKTSKNAEELGKAGNLFANIYDDIQTAALAGNKESAIGQINTIKELLQSQQYRELLDLESYKLALRKLDMYTKLANGEYESNEGKTNYVKDRYFIEYGVQPSTDEIQRILTEGEFFGVPTRKKVKTPDWKFEPPPIVPGVVPTHPSWSSNGAIVNPYTGYGQAYFPNRKE